MKTVDACATLSEDTFPIWGSFTAKSQFFEHEARHALAFRAHDERNLALEVRPPRHFLRMLARRADPEALFFQAFDRLGEVRDLRHVDVGNRAGRAFVRRRRYVRRALVGDDDAGSPNRLGGAAMAPRLPASVMWSRMTTSAEPPFSAACAFAVSSIVVTFT